MVDKQQKGTECRCSKTKQNKNNNYYSKEREKRETGVINWGMVDEQQK